MGAQFPATGALASLEDLPGIRPVRRRRAFAPAGAPHAAPVAALQPLTAPAAAGAPAAQSPASANPFQIAPARPGFYNPGEQIQDTITNGLGAVFSNLIKGAGGAGRRLLQGPPQGPPQQQGPPQGPPQQQAPPNQGPAPPLDPNAKFVGVSPDVTLDYAHDSASINGGSFTVAGHSVNFPDLSGIKLPAEPVLAVLRMIRDPTVLALDREARGEFAPAPAPDAANGAAAASGSPAPGLA